jgi:hypothetical protein
LHEAACFPFHVQAALVGPPSTHYTAAHTYIPHNMRPPPRTMMSAENALLLAAMRTHFYLYFVLCFKLFALCRMQAVRPHSPILTLCTLYTYSFVPIPSRLCPRNGWRFEWTLQRGRRPVRRHKFLMFSGSTPASLPVVPFVSAMAGRPASQPARGVVTTAPSIVDLVRVTK